jgi:hypothetical protein
MQHKDGTERASLPSDDVRLGMMEAVAGKLLVTATYNGREMTLAPHTLILRHGEMFAGALNLDKTWRSDESPRLGYFKLTGLSDVKVTRKQFEPIEGFQETVPQANDQLVLAVA